MTHITTAAEISPAVFGFSMLMPNEHVPIPVVPRPKTWWAPVWRGLVVDPGAKHYRRMGRALWLYLYFVLHADRVSGRLRWSRERIIRETGITGRTVLRWRALLERTGYIAITNPGKGHTVEVLRWKSVGRPRQSWRPPRQTWRGSRQSWHRTPS